MEVDFLLIGQGLAGTVLSHRLIQEGKSVHLIDEPKANLSTRIAAGLYNPITGKKMVKTWLADSLFPEIGPLYRSLEKKLDAHFFHPRKIYRPFLSIEELNEWMGRSGDENFQDYIDQVISKPLYEEVVNPYGGVMLKNSGYVDLNRMLDSYQQYLLGEGLLTQERFDEEKLTVLEAYVEYNGIKASKIVYCNGLGSLDSRFFNFLPFAPVKGEVLELEEGFQPEEIINRGVFRITLPDGRLKVGSTYSKHDLDTGVTERAKEEILEKYDKLIRNGEKKIISHSYGIRPATRDRKPFLGKHPEYESVYIFNGFGAKGVSLVPYLSKMMTNLLLLNQEVDKDVNISRFFKYI
ncbi:FAD-dependent oxidoreductase [Litoribacter ruber]|uniref:NAD(P)/FAD-dependent oxidoreductase n=1 Tax=Litoribacter ruber TaxID=702568 RepID=UPI001BDA3514|nr:FAD-dependent oxidoreductase [Litoribacter ruber]MBT0810882.1 FAD-dependent oxidoreductase [Litoribacter ruber]